MIVRVVCSVEILEIGGKTERGDVCGSDWIQL